MHLFVAAESTGGLAALGLNWTGLLFQLVNFGILFWVLQRWVFPPVIRLLERRRQEIAEGLEDAEAAKRARTEAEAERAAILEQARAEGHELIEAARTEAKQEAERIVKEAHAAADSSVTQAEQRITREQREAREQLMREIGQVVAVATAAVTREVVTPEADSEVVKKALAEVQR